VAKCGTRIVKHWAHLGRRDCDPWWENETAWHREWKGAFPEDWREISHTAPDGEIHRADVKTPKGIVLEVQHSSMSDSERHSREAFYKNLVWVIDGRPFASNFDIYHVLPHPASELAADLVWSKATRSMQGTINGMFFRVSENLPYYPGVTKATLLGGLMGSLRDIKDEVAATYCGHRQYDWVRPRKARLDATCPVYIDFGGDHLVKLEVYDETGLQCIRRVTKRRFIQDLMTKDSAADIAELPSLQPALIKEGSSTDGV
jgi:hypothetical protein